jgi:hypothetical protein
MVCLNLEKIFVFPKTHVKPYVGVSIFHNCHNSASQTGWLQKFVVTGLEAGSQRSRCQQGWFLLRLVSPLFVVGCLPPVSFHGLPSMSVP